MTDKNWEKFVEWCHNQWSCWTPHRTSVEICDRWREDEQGKVPKGTKAKA